jgi:CelD/BcsL family acetyltransferase involved in cellulose biosynthesis
LQGAAAGLGRPCPVVHREVRALLQSDLSPADYWDAAVRSKKRKELRRQANRLAELGVISHRRWAADDDLTPWVDAFLALEARGWKGANGSALRSGADTEGWFRRIMAGAAAQPDMLDLRAIDLDGRPIAMLISFYRGGGGFSFKTAFDEDLARFSPGVLLQQANLEMLTRPGLGWVDSCAAPDHPMIDSLWMERRALVWVNVPLAGGWNRAAFAAQSLAEAGWARVRTWKQEALS